MLKRSIFLGLLAGTLLAGYSINAQAAVADPSLGVATAKNSGVTDVRWLCGPYRCAWIPINEPSSDGSGSARDKTALPLA
jgi:hypothetical protein